MKAMVLRAIRTPLVPEDRPDPQPGPGEIRVLVEACAVCRTDLHVVDGDLPDPKLPIVPGRRENNTTVYPLERANDALADLRGGRFQGAAVLVP